MTHDQPITLGKSLEQEVPKSSVIVVNSAIQVLGITEWTDAMNKVAVEDADILIPRNDGAMVRSAHLTFPHPMVIQLRKWASAHQKTYGELYTIHRTKILARDLYTCAYCGERGTTIDHVIPKSFFKDRKTGQYTVPQTSPLVDGEFTNYNIAKNLVASCFSCNNKKRNRTPPEAGLAWPVIRKMVGHPKHARLQDAIYDRLAQMG